MILVTIVIINYNFGRFVGQAIESGLGQTYRDVEVIVVDDGSSDNSLEVITSFLPRIEVYDGGGRGHVEAANLGFARSQGELIMFVDADDVLNRTIVADAVAAWDASASKVQFMLETIDENGRDQGMQFPHFPAELDSAEILTRSLLTGYYPWPVSSGNLFARQFLRRVMPIDASVIFKSPDGYLNKLAPLHGAVRTLRRKGAAYRVHETNAWAQGGTGAQLTYARTVRFDVVLHGFFVAHARGLGFEVPAYTRCAVPQWIEVRLLSKRLDGEAHPIPGDKLAGITWLGIRAAMLAPGLRQSARALWALWFVAVATLPRPALRWLIRRARLQKSRSRVAATLISWGRRR